jgi:hypothetical protein
LWEVNTPGNCAQSGKEKTLQIKKTKEIAHAGLELAHMPPPNSQALHVVQIGRSTLTVAQNSFDLP